MTDASNAYLNTVSRLEPDIAMMDTAACLPSIAISLKRIADALDRAYPVTLPLIPNDPYFFEVVSADETGF
jgi:hypothetical protein